MDVNMVNDLLKDVTKLFIDGITGEGLLKESNFLEKANDGELVLKYLVSLYNDNLEITNAISDIDKEINEPIIEKIEEEIPVINSDEEKSKTEEIPAINLDEELSKIEEEIPAINLDEELSKIEEEIPVINLDEELSKSEEELPVINLDEELSKTEEELPVINLDEELSKTEEEIPNIEPDIKEDKIEDEIQEKKSVKVKVVKRNSLNKKPDKKHIKITNIRVKNKDIDNTMDFRSDVTSDDSKVVDTTVQTSEPVIEAVNFKEEIVEEPIAQKVEKIEPIHEETIIQTNIPEPVIEPKDIFSTSVSDEEMNDIINRFSSEEHLKKLEETDKELDEKLVDIENGTKELLEKPLFDFLNENNNPTLNVNIDTPVFDKQEDNQSVKSKLKKVVSRKLISVDKKFDVKRKVGALCLKCKNKVTEKFKLLANKLFCFGNHGELTEEERLEFIKMNNDIGNDTTLSVEEKSTLLKTLTDVWNKTKDLSSLVRAKVKGE